MPSCPGRHSHQCSMANGRSRGIRGAWRGIRRAARGIGEPEGAPRACCPRRLRHPSRRGNIRGAVPRHTGRHRYPVKPGWLAGVPGFFFAQMRFAQSSFVSLMIDITTESTAQSAITVWASMAAPPFGGAARRAKHRERHYTRRGALPRRTAPPWSLRPRPIAPAGLARAPLRTSHPGAPAYRQARSPGATARRKLPRIPPYRARRCPPCPG